MNKPRRYKNIYGDSDLLNKIASLYPDCKPEFRSDEYHFETIGYTRSGYRKDIRIEDGCISHISILVTSMEWEKIVKTFNLQKNVKFYGGWSPREI